MIPRTPDALPRKPLLSQKDRSPPPAPQPLCWPTLRHNWQAIWAARAPHLFLSPPNQIPLDHPRRTLYLTSTSGGLAERLRSGLQIREDRFDSGTRLQIISQASGFKQKFWMRFYQPTKQPTFPRALACIVMRQRRVLCACHASSWPLAHYAKVISAPNVERARRVHSSGATSSVWLTPMACASS